MSKKDKRNKSSHTIAPGRGAKPDGKIGPGNGAAFKPSGHAGHGAAGGAGSGAHAEGAAGRKPAAARAAGGAAANPGSRAHAAGAAGRVDKNVSKRYPNGRTLKTSDIHLPHNNETTGDLKENRHVIVIDSNSNDELAVVKLTTQNQPNTSPLPSYKMGNNKKSYYGHFVETKDNDDNAIKVDGVKFEENLWKYDLNKNEVGQIKDKVLKHTRQSSENKKKIKILKGIKKRED
jgi:hypothetical protein